MYKRNTSNYENLNPVGFYDHIVSPSYSSVVSEAYKSLISESKCMCRGTCRTGIGCTCK
jgi:hypothetical protein